MPPELSQGGDDLELSLEDSLGAAFDAHDTPDLGAPSTPKAPKETSRSAAPSETSKEAAARARDENGRFAPKGDTEGSGTTENDKTGRETADAVTRKPPASLSPDLHDRWSTLDPAIQDYLLKREKEFSTGIEEKSTALKRYEEQARDRDDLQKILEPYSQKWALNGQTTHQQVQRLLAAQDLLTRNPAEGIKWLAQQYRLNPAQIFAAAQDQSNNPPAQIHPLIAGELDKLRQAQADIAKKQTEWETARQAEREQAAVQTDIEKFKADPANKHFEAVKEKMAELLGKGQADTLAEAYEIATLKDPTVRQQILDEQIAARSGNGAGSEAAKAQARAEAAKKAKGAAISVKGAPSGPSAKVLAATLEEQLAANWSE